MTLYFEEEGLPLLQRELRGMVSRGRPEIICGMVTFINMGFPQMGIGAHGTLDVPYGQVFDWDPKTVICCDDGVMAAGAVWVDCELTRDYFWYEARYEPIGARRYIPMSTNGRSPGSRRAIR